MDEGKNRLKKVVNMCCGCAVPGYPCIGDLCERRRVEVYYCDKCGEELEDVYIYEGRHYCEEHLLEMFRAEFSK